MFQYLALILLVATACTASASATDDDAHAHVEKQYKKEDGHGKFSYGYDITNGIGAGEAGDEHQVHGEYHFTSKEGLPVKVSYTADENGYHPQGDLLPTPPPTPEAILRALAYIDSHPRREEPHALCIPIPSHRWFIPSQRVPIQRVPSQHAPIPRVPSQRVPIQPIHHIQPIVSTDPSRVTFFLRSACREVSVGSVGAFEN